MYQAWAALGKPREKFRLVFALHEYDVEAAKKAYEKLFGEGGKQPEVVRGVVRKLQAELAEVTHPGKVKWASRRRPLHNAFFSTEGIEHLVVHMIY